MNMKRFFAKTSREVLRMVKDELGDDAVIISNKMVDGGNEILAVNGQDMDVLTQETNSFASKQVEAVEKVADVFHKLTSRPVAEVKTIDDVEREISGGSISSVISERPINQQVMTRDEVSSADIKAILNEFKSFKSEIESHLSDLSFNNHHQQSPARKHLLKTMIGAGFGPSLSRHMVENMPSQLNSDQGLMWAKQVLVKNISAESDESEILDKGGIFALVGPTGVGKTTTIAKIAARLVMRHGTNKLAFITTDAYRIGGYEQLRIYGKILGVMVHAVKDESDLKIALEELKGKHTILIDTVGVSQRDQMVAKQVSMLANQSMPIKTLLCLNATNTRETLLDVVSAYSNDINNGAIDGCIITKVDEAASLGGVLDVILQKKLKINFLTNGQRVPEDIMIADKRDIVDQVFNHYADPDLNELLDDDISRVATSQPRLAKKSELEIHHA